MLKACVFPKYKTMITIIWFCIDLTANTCSLHENQHYHVWSSRVYIKQAMTWTLLLVLVAIVFTPNNVKTFFYIYSNFAPIYISDMLQIFEND